MATFTINIIAPDAEKEKVEALLKYLSDWEAWEIRDIRYGGEA